MGKPSEVGGGGGQRHLIGSKFLELSKVPSIFLSHSPLKFFYGSALLNVNTSAQQAAALGGRSHFISVHAA